MVSSPVYGCSCALPPLLEEDAMARGRDKDRESQHGTKTERASARQSEPVNFPELKVGKSSNCRVRMAEGAGERKREPAHFP